jgi:hypothetical protein
MERFTRLTLGHGRGHLRRFWNRSVQNHEFRLCARAVPMGFGPEKLTARTKLIFGHRACPLEMIPGSIKFSICPKFIIREL